MRGAYSLICNDTYIVYGMTSILPLKGNSLNSLAEHIFHYYYTTDNFNAV